MKPACLWWLRGMALIVALAVLFLTSGLAFGNVDRAAAVVVVMICTHALVGCGLLVGELVECSASDGDGSP